MNQVLEKLLHQITGNNRSERIWKLAQLDFRKRYYHDNLGIFWSLLRPLLRICVFVFVFKIVIKYEQMENYALFIFSGLIFWGIFSEGVRTGKSVLIKKRYLIENIQFNKVDLYLSDVLTNLISFCITFIAYTIIAYIFGIRYTNNFPILIILIVNLYFITVGLSMILAVLYIFFKDINHLWDIITLFLFWTSGVFLRGEKFLDMFPSFLYLNPLVGIMINVRQVIFFSGTVDMNLLSICLLYGLCIYVIGYILFNKYSNLAIEKY